LIALRNTWKNNYFKTAIAILLIVALALGFFFGLELGLKTSYPLLTVESGSMSIPYDGADNFWLSIEHPFDRTLSIGDIIVVQGINIKDLKTNYPNSDIIVFHSPIDGELIVHRIIATETVNGVTYFQTKGDGNGYPDTWPKTPTSGLDPWDSNNPPGVPQNLVVGKVIMRIPWLGWITLFMRGNPVGLPIIIAIILLLVVLEFIIPVIRDSSKKIKQQNNMKPPPPTTQMYL
jgi:signal peptidase I